MDGTLPFSFRDAFGRPCSVQKSRVGLLPAIWLGLNEARMYLDMEKVRLILPVLQYFLETGQVEPFAHSSQETCLPLSDGIGLADIEFIVRGHEAEALHQLLILLQQTRRRYDQQRDLLVRCRALLERPSEQIVTCEHDDCWQDWQNQRDALLKEMAEYSRR